MQKIGRRTVLQGLGVSLTLPFLPSFAPRPARAADKSGDGKPPVRLAVLYMANGVNPETWNVQGQGRDFELSPILSPLQNVKDNIVVLSELMNKASTGGDGHYAKVAPFLTGLPIVRTTGSNLNAGGASLDQIIAQRIGNLTPLPSLELSIEPITMGVDANVGFTRIYGSHISWSSASTPVSREVNPQAAFDRLFRQSGKKTDRTGDVSILDAVSEDARRLQRKVGAADRLKLEEYFEAVRSVEKRIAWDAARRRTEVTDDPLCRAEIEKVGGRIADYYKAPQGERGIDHTEQVRLMMDMMFLAFWTDSTRVATFMFANEVSGKNFSFLEGVSGGHHQISHHENNAEKKAEYSRIGVWHMAQYAYLLERLKSVKEGNGTLLDNSMILCGSGIKDGNAHSPVNIPLVLGGGGGGTIAGGRHLRYEAKTPLCNLYRSVAGRMGVPLKSFGDSTGELAGLSDAAFGGVPAPPKS